MKVILFSFIDFLDTDFMQLCGTKTEVLLIKIEQTQIEYIYFFFVN